MERGKIRVLVLKLTLKLVLNPSFELVRVIEVVRVVEVRVDWVVEVVRVVEVVKGLNW